MSRLQGDFLDGLHPVPSEAVLSFDASHAELDIFAETRSYPVGGLRVSPRVARARRFVSLPDGGQFLCDDHPALDQLRQDQPLESAVAWLERRVAMAVAGIALVFGIVYIIYFHGLPIASEAIVARIPITTEQVLGREVLEAFDDGFLMNKSGLDEETRDEIRSDFNELREGLSIAVHSELLFRSSSAIGANAFALPGGQIIITDQMVNLAETSDEIAAILAHELGHVEHRHIMRHMIQNSVTAVLVSAITADAASLSVAVVGLPTVVAQASYSREFETEADLFAFQRLHQSGRSPESFALIMERLSGDDDVLGFASFLSSHPDTGDRVRMAREAIDDQEE